MEYIPKGELVFRFIASMRGERRQSHFPEHKKGDLNDDIPLSMPPMISPGGPLLPAYRRQEKYYPLLKKVLVREHDGQVFRATDEEIMRALAEVPEYEGLSGLNGQEYVFAVKEMFRVLG